MLKLSKKSEYALMAIKYMALKLECGCIAAKEISEVYDIPYELLAKVLQKLKKHGLVKSYQGVKGGYCLNKTPEAISLIDVIKALDTNYKITDCMNEKNSQDQCSHLNCCAIRDPLIKVQREIDRVFRETSISQIL